MNLFIHNRLSGFRDAIRQRLRDRESRHSQLTDIRPVLERVVEGTDGRIRLVSGYQKKLHNAVSVALEYAEDLVGQIPRAIEINRNNFTNHDHLNAYFVDFSDLKRVINRSPEIEEFLHDHSAAASWHCCALLCMYKSEKTVMGMDLSGGMLKKDVMQVAVSFTDHMLYAPASSETETREGLKECLFGGLVTRALERIVQSRLDNRRLQDMRQMLTTRLMHLEYKPASGDESVTGFARDIENTRLELDKVDKLLMNSRPMTPQHSLEYVKEVFSRPDQFVRLSRYPLRLNRMGVKVNQDSTERCNRLDLTEVVIGDERPRVISLVQFSDEALLT